MADLQSLLVGLYHTLPKEPDELAATVNEIAAASRGQRSPELFKAEWELTIKNSLHELAAKEGDALDDPQTDYYTTLKNRLDVALTFTEQKICDPPFVAQVLEDLMDTHTVRSCERIFSWVEMRSDRITEGMIPQKGKALILLRALNDLLRRLSRTGGTTTFCGRILIFLSAVFPLGERSGVNLRGEFGPQFEPVKRPQSLEQSTSSDEATIPVESTGNEDLKKDDFFETFWSLQVPFSRPPLFATISTTLTTFQAAVNVVLPIISEATKKERALMGSKSGNTLAGKRKRDDGMELSQRTQDYFFAKYLTSPDLLELEIADNLLRRQVLCQILILLQHLLGFTEAEKKKWQGKTRSSQMDFTLEASQATWVKDTWTKAMAELRATTPNGKIYADTVNMILEREKNWINWKNENCIPPLNDRKPLPLSDEEVSKAKRQKLMTLLPDWEHQHGTEALSETWDLGYRSLSDLEEFQGPGETRDYLMRIQLQDKRIELRKKQLAQIAARSAAAAPPTPAPVTPAVTPTTPLAASNSQESIKSSLASVSPTRISSPAHPSLPPKPGLVAEAKQESLVPPSTPFKPPDTPFKPKSPGLVVGKPDLQIEEAEERKQALAWLALRQASKQFLHLFGRIGTGDIEKLNQEITNQLQKEKELPVMQSHRGISPNNSTVPEVTSTNGMKPEPLGETTSTIEPTPGGTMDVDT